MKKILVIGAHPDDCDIYAGGCAALWSDRGDQVSFISMTNGNAGHHREPPDKLEKRRREEAERAVWASKYPPEGGRSSGPTRAAIYGGADYQKGANDQIAVVCMIETAEALEKLDEILSTPGVDAAYVGPSDLAYALGMEPTGDNHDPNHEAKVMEIYEACRKHGVTPGIHTGSAEFTKKWLTAGFQMVTLGTDSGFMRSRAAGDLNETREATGAEPTMPGGSAFY